MKKLILLGLVACVGSVRAQSMPGMTMPGDPAPAKKKAAPKQALPEKPKPAMQGMPGMAPMHTDAPVDQTAGTQSVTHDTFTIQEPEDPLHRTGQELPAPELLNAVAARRPLSLDELLGEAERINPTLAEADAAARQSDARARQAKLYPNPTVGYEGDQIRGGSYGGGEQGGFIQQTVVLGGKLGLRSEAYRAQGRPAGR